MDLPAFCATRLAADDPLVALAVSPALRRRERLTDPAAQAVVLDAVGRLGYGAKLADIKARASDGVHIHVECWTSAAGQKTLDSHYDNTNGGDQVALLVYACAPGCAPWTGGELLASGRGASDGDREPDVADMVSISTAPLADGRVRVVAMPGTTWHCPTPSATGTRYCVAFHIDTDCFH